ncbi:MAG TPA: hypothetical protein VN641_05215 [Urbifossiella sp.]|nr:hypothetical protein [Urbifossiella sp.]
MLLFCPACDSAFTGVSRCPRCGGLLLMPEETAQEESLIGDAPAPLAPTPAGRAFVGTIVALGCYLGLRKLTMGSVFALHSSVERWWQSDEALVAVFLLQVLAAGFGAVLASAGRMRGIGLGALVGIVCGIAFLGAEVAAGTPPTQLVLLLQPVMLAVIGAIAGAAGAWFWPAVPAFDLPPPLVKRSSSISLYDDTPRDTRRPTVWWRVVLGAFFIVAGMTLAEKARYSAEKASGGMLRVTSQGQGRFMSWQIATLAVLLGGAVAGSGTGAGVRHGIYTGLLGGIGIAAMRTVHGSFTQPEEYLLTWMNLTVNGPHDPIGLLGIGMAVLIASFVGGWFGGQLFLPLAPLHMRQRRLHTFD